MIAGHPDDPNWDQVQEEAAKQLETLRKDCSLSSDQRVHRRGRFAALSYRISYGGGQTVHAPPAFSMNNSNLDQHPQNLHQTQANTAVLMALINCLAFVRLACFASCEYRPPPLD